MSEHIPEPEDGNEQDLEAVAKSRRWWRERARDAAMRGNGICGALFALEALAEPFFLGLDSDPDESDFDDMESQ
jgi:hypothetical protein